MKPDPTLKIITTEDGSHTIELIELNETFHSIHGAIQESRHVYIEAGLNYVISSCQNKKELSILEFGFGTGLNTLLTAIEIPQDIHIIYHTLDKYPLPEETGRLLNYGQQLNAAKIFRQIQSSKWEVEHQIRASFTLKKVAVDFRKFTSNRTYNLIYFDAFAPSKQSALWDKSIFKKCYSLLSKRGVLVTYSAKGQLKRDLRAIGFTVESLPGPPGKFEITRAIKQ